MPVQYKILITGSQGQVGSQCIRAISESFQFMPISFSHAEFNICDQASIDKIFEYEFNAVINCAAFTAVDAAQSDIDTAWKVNAIAPKLLAKACHQKKIPLLHFSTDYVYDNGLKIPLKETSPCNPKSIYAVSKYVGEQEALYYHDQTIIFRTSWVYSKTGQNFVNTILRMAKNKNELEIVDDQIGSPTYTPDLVDAVLIVLYKLLLNKTELAFNGIFNFSNAGMISWYDFAVEIIKYSGIDCKLIPVSSMQFPRPAPRPAYSVFDLSKINQIFGIQPLNWIVSLHHCLKS
ncbi:MAG: dTDP-4-dehydrorhamnose reductase [Saprospiraceae bacterium]